MTINEYAVIDNHGVLFGLPAKTFIEPEAAVAVLDSLRRSRERMQVEAEAAQRVLATGVETIQQGEQLQELVQRWEKERTRSWTIYGRTVSPWQAMATWGALAST